MVHSVFSKTPISLGTELGEKCQHCNLSAAGHERAIERARKKNDPKLVPNHPFKGGSGERAETDAPAHFNATYKDIPQKLGMTPANTVTCQDIMKK